MKNYNQLIKDLKAVSEVSAIITSTLDFQELITIVMEKAKEVMNAEASSILLYNIETDKLEFAVALNVKEDTSKTLTDNISLNIGEGIAGWVAQNEKSLIIKDAQSDCRFCKKADKATGFETRSIIAVPLTGRGGFIGVAEVINPVNKKFFTESDLELFNTLCMQVSVAIENARFHEDSLKREKLKRELEIASTIQNSFFPGSPYYSKERISVSVINTMASHVGGDMYDFVEFADSRLGVLIGDVSGKGISAALYMAKAISDFRYIAHSERSSEAVMDEVNRVLLSKSVQGMFLTAIYLIVDCLSGEIKLSCAGHPPGLLFNSNRVNVMETDGGPPLGIIPTVYPVSTIIMEPEERLLLFTDGVYDATDSNGERLGFSRIADYVEKNKREKDMIKGMIEFVNEFSGKSDQPDDITIVEVKFS